MNKSVVLWIIGIIALSSVIIAPEEDKSPAFDYTVENFWTTFDNTEGSWGKVNFYSSDFWGSLTEETSVPKANLGTVDFTQEDFPWNTFDLGSLGGLNFAELDSAQASEIFLNELNINIDTSQGSSITYDSETRMITLVNINPDTGDTVGEPLSFNPSEEKFQKENAKLVIEGNTLRIIPKAAAVPGEAAGEPGEEIKEPREIVITSDGGGKLDINIDTNVHVDATGKRFIDIVYYQGDKFDINSLGGDMDVVSRSEGTITFRDKDGKIYTLREQGNTILFEGSNGPISFFVKDGTTPEFEGGDIVPVSSLNAAIQSEMASAEAQLAQDLNENICPLETSFVAGTKINMYDGSKKNIEDIKQGDIVLSYDTQKEEFVPGTIVSTSEHQAKLLVVVNKKIQTTAEHPFYVVNKGYINAKELERGDVLIGSNGKKVKVRKIMIKKLKESVKVYNFDVNAGFYNNYFAGGVMVHNKWFCGTKFSFKPNKVFDYGGAASTIARPDDKIKFFDNVIEAEGGIVFNVGGHKVNIGGSELIVGGQDVDITQKPTYREFRTSSYDQFKQEKYGESGDKVSVGWYHTGSMKVESNERLNNILLLESDMEVLTRSDGTSTDTIPVVRYKQANGVFAYVAINQLSVNHIAGYIHNPLLQNRKANLVIFDIINPSEAELFHSELLKKSGGNLKSLTFGEKINSHEPTYLGPKPEYETH
tara:strand:- start:6105 stop:8222 length:2118 start_codon:yes stop_codon:yes gene_type:complete